MAVMGQTPHKLPEGLNCDTIAIMGKHSLEIGASKQRYFPHLVAGKLPDGSKTRTRLEIARTKGLRGASESYTMRLRKLIADAMSEINPPRS